ncbi:NfeD family protein [candidate division KSB1 bacterium]
MSWLLIVILIVIGLIFLLLEILVIPGATVAGIIGGAVIVFGIYEAYHSHGNIAGHYTLVATIVATLLVLVYAIRSKTWKKAMLHSEIDSKVNIIDEEKIKVGDTGIAISRLAPSGKARINDNLYEVHTMGSFVDQETEIEVVKINFNKIIVKLK